MKGGGWQFGEVTDLGSTGIDKATAEVTGAQGTSGFLPYSTKSQTRRLNRPDR
jgi:hypothetical protein